MKKSLFFTFWMTLLASVLTAQNVIDVSGEYHGHVLWDADTVKLVGDVVIEPDVGGTACLTVERGTYVIAEGYYRITVHNGSFYALGAEKAPVTFTARNTADFDNPEVASGWRGIRLVSDQISAQDTVFMEYSNVSYGKVITSAPEEERFGAGLEVRNKEYCYFAHCHFLQNRDDFDSSSPNGSGGGGMFVFNPGTILIEYCVFHDNYAWWGASVSLRGLRHFTVRNCEFYNNSGHYGTALDMHVGELSLYASGPQVYNNYIHGNHGNTAYLGWEGVGRLHDNIIVNNEGYSPVLGTTAPNYSHYYNNTIANNQSEGHIHGYGSGIWTNGQQKIYNNIFWGNTGIWFERMDPSHPDPTVFNNCNGTLSGEGDVYGDPEFVRPTTGLGPAYDYSTMPSHWALLETSPCINAGASHSNYYPTTDFLGNPRIKQRHIDIGAIEWQDPEEVEKHIDNKLVSVYPNPGKDVLKLTVPVHADRVEVYDLNGRKVFDGNVTGNQIIINVETWPSGMYFWKVVSTGSTALVETGKWIKE